jgi:hypothetical protein
VKPMDSNDECIHAEMWWKMQASFLVLSERWCQRECVRECVREMMSESVRARLSERVCQRACQRVSESDCQRLRIRVSLCQSGLHVKCVCLFVCFNHFAFGC